MYFRSNKIFLATLFISIIKLCNPAIAQSYEIKNGYIFEQKYVQRISVQQAEKFLNKSDVFESLMSFDWIKEKEVIKNSTVKRIGDRLVLSFPRNIVSLKNFSTTQGDGEMQNFKYIKSIPGYHIIGIEYTHDQPHFLLVSESGNTIYFVKTD